MTGPTSSPYTVEGCIPPSKIVNASYRGAGRHRDTQPKSLSRGIQCPRWVNRVVLTVRRPFPVYPDKQTIEEPVRTSHSCQKPPSRAWLEITNEANNRGSLINTTTRYRRATPDLFRMYP